MKSTWLGVVTAAACLAVAPGAAAAPACPVQKRVVTLSDVGAGGLHWAVTVPAEDRLESVYNLPAPVVADGVAYSVAEGRALAVRVADGRMLWDVAAPPKDSGLFLAGPVVVAVADGRLTAFDRATGRVRWHDITRRQTNGVSVVAGGRDLAVSTSTGTVAVVDPATGHTRWSHRAGAGGTLDLYADAATVVGPTRSGYAAWDAATGKALWSRPLLDDAVGLVDGTLVLDSTPDGLTGVDARTGSVRWNRPLVDSFVVDLGTSLLAAADGRTLRLDARTGRLLWSAKVAMPQTVTISGGVVAGEAQADDGGTPFAEGVRLSDGTVVWKHLLDKDAYTENDGSTRSGPTLLTTDFTSHRGKDASGVASFDVATGARHWVAYAPLQPAALAQDDGRGGAVVLGATTKFVCTVASTVNPS